MSRRRLAVAFALSVSTLPSVAAAQAPDASFVEVHGHRIAFYVTGTTGPTVVMEAGGGSWHRDWTSIAPQLAQHARVITYDRPGYARSGPCESPRTANRVVRELLEGLEATGHKAPYILVGWSLGAGRDEEIAGDPISRVWVEELTKWAAARPNSTATVVPGVGHHIPAQAPEAIVQAVTDLVRRTQ